MIMDIKPRKKIADMELAELIDTYSEQYQHKLHITIGKSIPVKSPTICSMCGGEFLAGPYQWNHPGECQEQADYEMDNWRNKE